MAVSIIISAFIHIALPFLLIVISAYPVYTTIVEYSIYIKIRDENRNNRYGGVPNV
jgi:hypothetical protein